MLTRSNESRLGISCAALNDIPHVVRLHVWLWVCCQDVHTWLLNRVPLSFKCYTKERQKWATPSHADAVWSGMCSECPQSFSCGFSSLRVHFLREHWSRALAGIHSHCWAWSSTSENTINRWTQTNYVKLLSAHAEHLAVCAAPLKRLPGCSRC